MNKPKGWFEEAHRIYAKAMSIIEDYNTTFNYAYFLQEHRQIRRAARIYEKNINHCSNPAVKASTLNNLAVLQSNNNEFGKAELPYLEALEIRRKFADENPKVFLIPYGDTCIGLSVISPKHG